ncbi:MAG: hypothetical protein Q8868_08615 [Bacteroidota bacterium]|nr:hypothetical protein [Bacteroidota bacterium]
MSVKWERRIKDNIYWIFPFIFMGLAFYQVRQDRNYGKQSYFNLFKADSSITMSVPHGKIDSLWVNRYRGNNPDPSSTYSK